MSAVPFADSGKCNGTPSPITGRTYPMCLTCSRYTLKPGAPVAGKVCLTRGAADCEHWKPLAHRVE